MANTYSTLSTKGSERLTLDQIKRKRAIADALMTRGFQQTRVAPGGSYTGGAALADALTSIVGSYSGHKQNKALDAREAELAREQKAIQDELANATDPLQTALPPMPEQTVEQPVEPTPLAPGENSIKPAMLGAGPVNPAQAAAAGGIVAPPVDPKIASGLAQALMGGAKIAPPQQSAMPLTAPATPPVQAIAQAMGSPSGRQGLTPVPPSQWKDRPPPILPTAIPRGEYSHRLRDTPDGMPMPGDYENDEREQLATMGMAPEDMEAFMDREKEARDLGHPDYQPGMAPDGQTLLTEGQLPELGATDVLGRRNVTTSDPQPQPVPAPDILPEPETRAPPPPLPQPQPELLKALMSQMPGATPQQSVAMPAAPAAAPAPALVDALMQSSGLSMPAALAPVLPKGHVPSVARVPEEKRTPVTDNINDRYRRIYKAAVRAGDQKKADWALDRMYPEDKKYVIGKNLVNDKGDVVYKDETADNKLTHVDAGDRILFYDVNNRLVRTEMKGLAPQQPGEHEQVMDELGQAKGSEARTESLKARQAKLNHIPVPASTNINVDTKGENAFAKKMGENYAEGYAETVKKAGSARSAIPMIHEMREMLDKGIISGPFATWRLKLEKFGRSDLAANTETYSLAGAKQTVETLKQLGVNPTDTDRTYMERVVAGDIELNEKSMRRMLTINERVARTVIQQANKKTSEIKNDPRYSGISPFDDTVEEPETYDQRKQRKLDAKAAKAGGTVQTQARRPVQAKTVVPGPKSTGPVPKNQRETDYIHSVKQDIERERLDSGERAPPSDLPQGTTLHKVLPNGNPVWALPNGKYLEQTP